MRPQAISMTGQDKVAQGTGTGTGKENCLMTLGSRLYKPYVRAGCKG